MSEKPDGPQFPADGGDGDDAGGQAPRASTPDIAELIRVIDSGEQPSGATIEAGTTKAHMRMISRSILEELQSLGVAEAGQVAERLEELDSPDDPMGATLHEVAASYQQERSELNNAGDETPDADATTQLQKLAALSEAAFGISLLQASTAINGVDTPGIGVLKEFAAERVKATENLQFPAGTSQALADVLDNAAMPPQRILGRDN